MTITCTYPGRAALIGEHCDWASGASLAVPLPMSITVSATAGDEDLSCRTELDGRTLSDRWPVEGAVDPAGDELRFVPAAAFALQERGIHIPPTHLEVTSTLPPGRGFSSSAAFSLGVIDALARQSGTMFSREDIAELAFHVERELLGVQCGRLDQLACVWKHPLFLRWKDGEPIEVKPLTPQTAFYLVVIAFSKPRDTPGILAELHRHFFAENETDLSRAVRRALSQWAALAQTGAEAIERGDPTALGHAMNKAQTSYETELARNLPPLRGPLTSAMCADLRSSHGAIGAKFSGAGGDGSVVALFENDADAARAIGHLNRLPGTTAWRCNF